MDAVRHFKTVAKQELKKRREAGDTVITLQQAQHLAARSVGFKNWAELLNADEDTLDLAVLMQRWPNLTHTGLDGVWGLKLWEREVRAMSREDRAQGLYEMRRDLLGNAGDIAAAREWIVDNMVEINSINHRRTSYNIKHTYERAAGQYVTNGAFIAAALLAGFRTNGSPTREQRNVSFNMSERAVKAVDPGI